MYLDCSSITISFQGQRSKVKVTAKVKIRNRRNSFNILARAKFKKKNEVLLKANLYDLINFQYHFRFKRSPEVENRKCEIAISIFVSFQHSSNLIAYLETTYLNVGLNFRYNFRFKNAPEPQNGGNFENFGIF